MTNRVLAGFVAFEVLAATVGCGGDPVAPRPGPVPGPVESPDALVREVAVAYTARSLTRYISLVADEPGARFRFFLDAPDRDTGIDRWGPRSALVIHSRLFEPDHVPATDPQVPFELWLQGVDATFARRTDWLERPDLYTDASPPGTLDPVRWIAREAVFETDVFFSLAGETDYEMRGPASFVVLEDRTKTGDTPGRFLVYRWEELPNPRTSAASLAGVEEGRLGSLLLVYAPPPTGGPSPESRLVDDLADAYRARDVAAYDALLGADFRFVLNEPDPHSGETSWDRAEEMLVHRRMFEPQNAVVGEPPVPATLWLRTIDIALTQRADFTERTDVYATPANPGGVDRETWRASEGLYMTSAYFDLQGETDYAVYGGASFIVLTLRDELPWLRGISRLHLWTDLGSQSSLDPSSWPSGAEWSAVKNLYRLHGR